MMTASELIALAVAAVSAIVAGLTKLALGGYERRIDVLERSCDSQIRRIHDAEIQHAIAKEKVDRVVEDLEEIKAMLRTLVEQLGKNRNPSPYPGQYQAVKGPSK